MFTFEYGCGDANANISKWPVLMTTTSVYVTFFWHQANHMKIVVFLLNREKNIISSRSYTKYYPARTRFILAGCQKKKILQEANIQNGWHKLEEKWLTSVVFKYMRAWYSHFMFGGSFTSIRYSKILISLSRKNAFIFPRLTDVSVSCSGDLG